VTRGHCVVNRVQRNARQQRGEAQAHADRDDDREIVGFRQRTVPLIPESLEHFTFGPIGGLGDEVIDDPLRKQRFELLGLKAHTLLWNGGSFWVPVLSAVVRMANSMSLTLRFSSKTRSRPLLSTLPHRTAGTPEHRNEGDATGQDTGGRARAHPPRPPGDPLGEEHIP
jgi:hypothetical protein